MSYVRSAATIEELNTQIAALGKDLKTVSDKLETTMLSAACVMVADYISFIVDTKGERPKEADIRSHFQNTMEIDTKSKTTKGTLAVVLSNAIKCGTLVFMTDLTSFSVMYYLKQGSQFLDAPAKGASREIVFKKNFVYPNRREGAGDKARPVPESDHQSFATLEAINWAYGYYVNGTKRDEYGRPAAGKKASHNVPLDKASPNKLFERAGSVLNALKKTEGNKELAQSLAAAAAEFLGEDAEEIEVTNKVVLIDNAGNLCSLTAVLNVVREEIADKPLHLHEQVDQELILSLYDLIKGMIETAPLVKPLVPSKDTQQQTVITAPVPELVAA